ncbi:MAG: WecB/TagA/CpsF family glycosyltransferase [Planctomycetota bacterium]
MAPTQHIDRLAPARELVRDPLPVVRLRGVPIHSITEAQCVEHIMAELDEGRGGWVVTHNLDHLRRRMQDEGFDDLCTEASVITADGMPLVWASRLQGEPLPERVAGSNLISTLSAAAAARDRSIFLLGGDPGTAEAAADVLRARHPDLVVAGCHCPPPGFEGDPQASERLVDAVVSAAPDVVFVALGSPKQERLIQGLRPLLPGTWWLGVGISFSFLCGDVRRAPHWMQRWGLEWLHRLVQEPRRLGRRYLIDGLPFALWLLASAAVQRRRPHQSAD